MGLQHEIFICTKYKTFLIALLIIFSSSNPKLFYLIGVNHTISTEEKLKLVWLEKYLLGRKGKFKHSHMRPHTHIILIVWACEHPNTERNNTKYFKIVKKEFK